MSVLLECEPGFIRLPLLGSVYWERDIAATWVALDTERHDGEVEVLWGRWRIVLTAAKRLLSVSSASFNSH